MAQPVKINIGGEKLVTVYPDLLRVAGVSKLSTIGSDSWESPLDSDGNVFVDYSPGVFMPLIEWLREVRDAEPGQQVLVQVEDRRRSAWIRMMGAFAFPPQLLRLAGIGAGELAAMGFSASHLHSAAGFSVEELVLAGFQAAAVRDLLKDGELTSVLSNVRPSVGSWTLAELESRGFTESELTAAGFIREESGSLFGAPSGSLFGAPLFGSANRGLFGLDDATSSTLPAATAPQSRSGTFPRLLEPFNKAGLTDDSSVHPATAPTDDNEL
ncbi:Shkbp1 [Symbiodinium natans]|uniref:Shkbp1 protein n=1 Tax=Symbiodinium natans TaxID=878477 RepID=A0A812NN15_9DINO|nr:Shkbp1 [Symbiodinium natans]